MEEDKTYFSYLLRIWRATRAGKDVWLASLDEPRTGTRHSFTSLESLFAFLLKQSQIDLQAKPDVYADGERQKDGTVRTD